MASFSTDSVYRFAGFTLDLEKSALLSARGQMMLRPKAQALLTHLARNMGRVVPKSELLDTVWPDIYVTEDSLTQSIRELRKALGDEDQRLIRTVSKRGYLLAADPEPTTDATTLPVLSVFRFRNETGDSDLTTMIDGFAEDVISGLARFRSVVVLARQSSFTAAESDGDLSVPTSGERADFAVEASVRRLGQGLRLSVALLDVRSRVLHWNESFDLGPGGFYDTGVEIAERVISQLAVRVDAAGITRAERKRPENLEAHDLMMKGIAISRRNDPAEFPTAARLLTDALARDPNNGLALAHLAFIRVMQSGFGRSTLGNLAPALELAARAVSLAPDQPTAHRALSFVQMYRREFPAAEYHMRKSLELNPFDPDGQDQMGYLLTLRGRPLEGLEWIHRAIRLNPLHPPWFQHDRAFALYLLGEYRAAAEAIELTPLPPVWMRTWLAACYAQMGQIDKAREQAAKIREQDPEFSAETFARRNGAAFEHSSDHQHFAEGVLMALGLPTDTWSDTRDPEPSPGG